MSEDLHIVELKEPYNPTDPVVVFDPTLTPPTIVKNYDAESKEDTLYEGDLDHEFNVERVQAVYIPMIQFNNTELDVMHIIEFKLSVCDFCPELDLTIDDYFGLISSNDMPGVANKIKVILTAPVEGASKKIALEFYIEECKPNIDGTISCHARYNLNELFNKQNLQLGSDKLNTYETLEEIAKKTKLGFAATDKCKDIQDKRWRQVYGESYADYIQEILKYAGVDNESIFDAWVDEYGYLVMVNVPWVMGETVDLAQLTIKCIKGAKSTNKKDITDDNVVELVQRTLTNDRQVENSNNLIFHGYEQNTNTNDVMKHGTTRQFFYMKGLGDTNTICQSSTFMMPTSIDEVYLQEKYECKNMEFIGFEMPDDDDEESENTPLIVQQENIKTYFDGLYSKTLTITMPRPNYLLQRGTLVYVEFYEYSVAQKKQIEQKYDSPMEIEKPTDISVENNPDEADELARNYMFDKSSGYGNTALTGLYYIKDITFRYCQGYEEIQQIMTLVKRGLRNNLDNEMTTRKLTPQKQ